ncbi:MAG: bifunctional demethylmenaquinone methyltransferase/2-methoxy-6-polyprenyl-1,4-benzoquinol methylase UbiE [Myxococcaceae bacterium]|jgi:demethylmenaquinone methyltransferase/2-methoxy-6-polyprenyl-1,4-benzoquinol methylase|nr:bifunctional demethylmenaquinone methyltransferase/2-methoxy-6-polyprenyl-1,4-benzoquinol methylase UbiE [Myxococcaceae bacterium]
MSEQVHQMFTQIAPRYDVTNDVLSMGTHRLWRKTAVRLSKVKAGDAVLDCATGTGDLAIDFKRAVGPGGTVKGTDFNAAMLSSAPAKAKALGLDISFEVADAMKLPYPAQQFDVSSISFGIRNVDDPKVCLGELARVVKPGGRVVVLEFGQPEGAFGAVFRLYAKLVMPLIGQVLTGNRAAYEYLPRTAAAFPAGERFVELMRSTGAFSEQSAHPLMAGLAYVYVGVVR